MAIHDLFSKRRKARLAQATDPLIYTDLPNPLRVKIAQIWFTALGDQDDFYGWNGQVRSAYDNIVRILCREYGTFRLPDSLGVGEDTSFRQLFLFFGQTREIDKALDAIELIFRTIDVITREYQYLTRPNASAIADASISELNHRFQEHGVGYRFSDGRIVRIDSELIHSEVVVPALHLLSDSHYAGAQAEYLKAHEHYRKGNGKEAMTECAKSLESLLKSICDKRKWKYDKNATAKPLINICFDKGLIPRFWESHFSYLRSMLDSSVPVARNKISAHGQGAKLTEVPNYLVAYMLHMTASTIVFLAEAEAAL